MANYNILPLSTQTPKEKKKYFFDANAWIYISENSTEAAHKPYIKFFYDLIAFIDNFDKRKEKFISQGGKIKPGHFDDESRPSIILTVTLVSEMFNVLIKARWEEYKKMKPNAKYKSDFRGSDAHIDAMKSLRDDLRSYQNYYTMIMTSLKILI